MLLESLESMRVVVDGVERLEGTAGEWENAACLVSDWGVRALRPLAVLLGLRGSTKLRREALVALIVATMLR